MASNPSIIYTLINPGLIKDSYDNVRNTFGGYYNFVEDSDGVESYGYSASAGSTGPNSNIVDYDTLELFQKSVRATITTASAEVFNTNLSINVVIVGQEDVIENDKHWKEIIAGGEYNTSSYTGIQTSGFFENFFVETKIPYDLYNIKTMAQAEYGDYKTISVGYKYNYYDPSYEAYAGRQSTYEIPNVYLLNAAAQTVPKTNGFEAEMANFVNLGGEVEADGYVMSKLFSVSSSAYPPFEEGSENQQYPKTSQWLSDVGNYKKYLSLYQSAALSGSTSTYLMQNSSNIIIDNDMLDINSDNLESIPFYTHVSIPSTLIAVDFVNKKLQDHKLKNLMMKTIKERFVDSRDTIESERFKYWQQSDQLEEGAISENSSVTEVDYKKFDLLPTILNDIQSPVRSSRNFMCLTDDGIEQHMVTDVNGTYRHIKNTRLMGFATDLVEHMRTNYGNSSGDDFYDKLDASSLSEILDYANTSNHIESIGYRIQKVGGTPQGQQRSINTLCNYYIFDEGDAIDLYDTQVKYGANYRYNIYQYVAMVGYRYSYRNFAATRQIGDTKIVKQTGNFWTPKFELLDRNCLEFYDLATGKETTRTDPREPLGDTYAPLDTTFSTDAQVLSEHKYLCEFDIVIEPYVKIIEIPIVTKETQVMDHPPRQVEIMSYQRKDDSQTIGFYAKYESFEHKPYPLTISVEDQKTRQDYMVSNNLYADEEITQESTRPIAVEVYRIDKKPTTMRDFRGSLIAAKDLTNLKFGTPLTDCFYEQRIRTNTKYYYLFRFLNAHYMPGHTSPVVEAELVDDGGYKYSLFNVINDSEITDEPPVDAPSKPFKKLLQMKLRSSHLILGDENVDYEGNAGDQVSNFTVGTADQPVWDKTFKIRMTSKKTGKKLDINVTYKGNWK